MKRALVIGLLLTGCYDFRGQFEKCRDAGLCVDDQAAARLEVVEVLAGVFETEAGRPSGGRVMTVRNAGAQTSGLISVTVDGGAFTVMSDNSCDGVRLDPLRDCRVNLLFSPPTAGSFPAEIVVRADPGGEVRGTTTGIALEPAEVIITPGNKNFLKVTIGQDSAPSTFTVLNTGPGLARNVVVSTFLPFELSGQCPAMLLPQQSCDVQVKFRSTLPVDMKNGSLTVTWDPMRTAIASLSGESVNAGTLAVNPTMHLFRDVNTGTFVEHTFVVRAGDNNPTGAITAVLSDAGSPWFSIVGGDCGPAGVTQMTTCDVRVRFAPEDFQDVTGSLEISGANAGTTPVSLSGRGIDFVLLQVSSDGGDGIGRVLSADGGVDCGPSCEAQVRRFTPVQLNAVASPLNEFQGWSGACTGLDASCDVVVGAPLVRASAAFGRYKNLTVEPGRGWASFSPDAGICDAGCTRAFPPGSTVTVNALTVDPFHAHTGWTGCTSDAGSCTVVMSQDRSVTAAYSPYNLVFVTSSAFPAGSIRGTTPDPGGLTLSQHALYSANAICMSHAADAGFTGTFRAWLSARFPGGVTHATDPSWGLNLSITNGWVRPDGRPIGPSFVPVWYPIRLDEHGNDVGSVVVATSTDSNGMFRPNNHCGTYGSADAGVVDYGLSSALEPHWTAADTTWSYMTPVGCDQPVRLYCYGASTKNVVRPPTAPAGARRAFVSSMVQLGALSDANADLVCQTEASTAGLTGTFVALRARSMRTALSLLPTSGLGWYRTDGAALFPLPSGVTSDPLTALDRHADGTRLPITSTEYHSQIFTGSRQVGGITMSLSTCNDWTTSDGTARLGTTADSVRWWWNGATPQSNLECGQVGLASQHKRLYCFQQ